MGIIVRTANHEDLSEIESFLSLQEIDESFKKPLSLRKESINERVKSYYEKGTWIISLLDDDIHACVALKRDGNSISLSTLAIRPLRKSKKAALEMWPFFISNYAKNEGIERIILDSWEGNKTIENTLISRGFEKSYPYPDDSKRPEGTLSVTYTKNMSSPTINAYDLKLPFKKSFAHAQKRREETSTILVSLKEASSIHWGEGCPRDYVTGETYLSAVSFVKKWTENKVEFLCLADLENWVRNNEKLIDKNPSAWCAIELAWISLLAFRAKKTVEELLGIPKASGNGIDISAPIGLDDDHDSVKESLLKYSGMGVINFKVKLSGNEHKDRNFLGLIKEALKGKIDVRADFNNSLSGFTAQEIAEYLRTLNFPFSAIEEPTGQREFDKLNMLAELIDYPIILDESFCKRSDLDAIANPQMFIPNLRISKLGGIIRTKDLLEQAKGEFNQWALGCMVGETGILSRYWLTMFSAIGVENLSYQEGLYSNFQFEKDIASNVPFITSAQSIKGLDSIYERPGQGIDIELDMSVVTEL